ncbi:MAG: hypothetical protein AAB870_03315, partial [Patescibacteria group bacterium]
ESRVQTFCIAKSEKDCVELYHSLIQTSRKKKEPLIIITPNDERTAHLAALLSKNKDIIISRADDGLRATRLMRTMATNGTCVVLIGTRHLLATPFKNLHTIIVDQSEHRNHKLHEGSPLIDSCSSAYHKAQSYRARLIYTSCAPRLEEYSYIPCTHPKTPYTFSPTIISLHDEFRGGNTSHVSERLQEEIAACLKRNEDGVLSLNLTGMSKYIQCKGCKTVFTCPDCNEPLRYTQRDQKLMCPTCTHTQIPPDTCPVCHDVNFIFPGLGIEKIAQQLSILFPDVPIVLVDAKNTTPLPPPGTPAIIVGTSYLPHHYPDRVAHAGLIGLITADPIVSMEQFRSLEQQWQDHAFLLSLKSPIASCVIQAFNTDHPFVQSLATLDYHRFADSELALRKTHSLPPTQRHIVCIYKG